MSNISPADTNCTTGDGDTASTSDTTSSPVGTTGSDRSRGVGTGDVEAPARPRSAESRSVASRRTPTLWEVGRRTGAQVVWFASFAMLAVALADVLVTGRLSLMSDVGFVAVCVAATLQVRPRDFFVCGVLPPLLMCGLAAVVAVFAPSAVAGPGDGPVQATVSTLAHHAGALVLGYGLTLAILALRQMAVRGRLPAQTQRRHG